MTVERIPIDIENNREAWLAMRKLDVTASDVAVVCGVSPFKTALHLWAEKIGEAPDAEENVAMKRGRYLEDVVVNLCRKETGWRSIMQPRVYLRDKQARIGATPDAIATDDEGEFIVQCKVVSPDVFARWQGAPPIYYQLQTLTEAMLWGAPRAMLAVLVNDSRVFDLRLFNVERHAGSEQRIREAVAQFWRDVEAGVRPAVDYERDGDLLRQLYRPNASAPPLDLTGDNLLTIALADRDALKDQEKAIKSRLDAIENEIVHKLDGASLATCGEWKITHTLTNRKEYTVPAKTFPVLRVTKLGEKT